MMEREKIWQWAPFIRAIMHRRGANLKDPDQCFCECLLAVWRCLSKGREERPYIARAILHAVIVCWQQEERLQGKEEPLLGSEEFSEEEEPEYEEPGFGEVESRLTLEAFVRHLGQTEVTRPRLQVLVRALAEGRSLRGAAEVLGCHPSLAWRDRRRLQTAWQQFMGM